MITRLFGRMSILFNNELTHCILYEKVYDKNIEYMHADGFKDTQKSY